MTQLIVFPQTLPDPIAPASVRAQTQAPEPDLRFTEVRVRTKIPAEELEAKKGKILAATDLDMLLTGPSAVYLPNGQLMAKYIPRGVLANRAASLEALRDAGKSLTDNRGLASGYERRKLKPEATRTRTPLVPSAMIGSADPGGAYRYCRLTAWTGDEWDRWVGLHPLFATIDSQFARYVPDRYAIQKEYASRTQAEWIVGNTAFTTITVNRSYPTGVHTDAGDLEAGFSNLAVYRTGNYSGGIFTFPEYRLGVDMQDGDLLLMDAHQWHGNTYMECDVCGEGMGAPNTGLNQKLAGDAALYPNHDECGTERISIVCYYRTKMAECGTVQEEYEKAKAWAEKRIDAHMDEGTAFRAQMLEEMAAEAV